MSQYPDARKRKIFFMSGSRADYGRLAPIWSAVMAHPSLDMVLCVTGTHLAHEFGFSRKLFDEDGFRVDYEIPALLAAGETNGATKGIGLLLVSLSDILLRERPDMVFVFGDRSEMLAPAIASIHHNIPLCHMAGGFASFGVVDEAVRHALTKMAHVHLATSLRCAERIALLGEERERIHFVGSPAIDALLRLPVMEKEAVFQRFGLSMDLPLVIATFHPVTTELEDVGRQADIFFAALGDVDAQVVVTYPNADLGGARIMERLRRLENMRVEQDLSMELYVNIMRHADVMVGNSSSGFIEAPYFHLPVVNVGNRQMGRDREANIIDVSVDREAIAGAMKNVLGNAAFREQVKAAFRHPYGIGESARRTVEILATVPLGVSLLQKRLTYA